MQLVFSDQPIPNEIVKSIFLAGPSPRSKDVFDWRHDALHALKESGFDGTVFVPIPKNKFYGEDDDPSWTYINQIQWECKARLVSDKIVFWVARDIEGGMPAFTTNVEFGEDLISGKILYGRPDSAHKCRYLDARYAETKQSVFNKLEYLMQHAIAQLGQGAKRTGGEIHIPLFIWETEQFQSWYENLKSSGNKLTDAKILQFNRFPSGEVFSFVMWVNVWVTKENRFKSNELIFSRKDISTVVAYHKKENETFIVLIDEFRSAVNNKNGLVTELPGGSSPKHGIDPKINAQHELYEEAGLFIQDTNRFQYVATRQLCATLSTHQAYVYKIELTATEFEKIVNTTQTLGCKEDGECTMVKILSMKDLINTTIDYSMLGMIYQALQSE